MPRKLPELPASIELAGQSVSYLLRRSARRSIGLAIDHRGLRVGAPLRAPIAEIEAVLRKHGRWVVDKLGSWQQRQTVAASEVHDGMRLPWLGATLTLEFVPASGRRNQAVWDVVESGEDAVVDRDRVLRISLAQGADSRRVTLLALKARAAEVLSERLLQAAQRHRLVVSGFALSSARTRWGSCSASGAIRLNWRLMLMPLSVIDYVIAHELAHLKQMNHSPRFWSEVEALCPDWQAQRLALRRLGREIPNF